MKPTKITKDQAKKILKATAYVAASAAISKLIAINTEQPDLFGALTPVVNVVLVTLKQAFSD